MIEAFLATKLGRWVVGVVAAVAAVAGLFFAVFRAGKQAARTESLEKTVHVQREIADADARGPRTADDVDRRLRDGTF